MSGITSAWHQDFADKFKDDFKNSGDTISIDTYCQRVEEYRHSFLLLKDKSSLSLLSDPQIKDSYKITKDLVPRTKQNLDAFQASSFGYFGVALLIAFAVTVILICYNSHYGHALFAMNKLVFSAYMVSAAMVPFGCMSLVISSVAKHFYKMQKIDINRVQDLIYRADMSWNIGKAGRLHDLKQGTAHEALEQ